MPYAAQAAIFFGVIALFSVSEYFLRRSQGKSYDGAAVASTFFIAFVQSLSRILTRAPIAAVIIGAYALAPFKLQVEDWWAWVIGFFAIEFVYYWQHRFLHTIRWFWATHSVHHSPNEFTFPVALRLGWTGGITGTWLFLIPLAFAGVPPLMIGLLYFLNLQYQFFLHTELFGKLGPIEWIFNTPSHHRVHHGSNPEYLDKNFGGVLIIFDRMFGTFAEERDQVQIQYGLTDPITTKNPFVIAFREWGRIFQDVRTARSTSDVLQALFGRPGTYGSTPGGTSQGISKAVAQ